MKNKKERFSTQCNKSSKINRRCSSAGLFNTSSAGAVTSLILMVAFGVVGVNQAHATASTLTISVTDSVSLDMASSIDTGNFAHSDTSTNNVSIITNNGTGYTLGIKAKTNNSNALINSDDTSKTIPSITTSISEATYASSSTYNNTWGFRPSKLNSAVNENYIQAPTSASTLTTLDKTTSANPSTANNYNLSIGARINNSTTPGSYSNVFVLTVTANPIPYTITYNKNTTDTVTNMPANTSSQTYDETVNIANTVPVRGGFTFKGWCTTQTADGGTCTGTTYNPDGGGTDLNWTLDQTVSSNSLTLYAMWATAGIDLYNTIASAWVSEGSRVMTNDTNASTGIKAAISKSNSGVFKYNPTTFGTSSDAANTHDIYFYRGILDTTVGSYGSDGDNAAHPNTVILDANNNGKDKTDTCWRIVRTTGSGGVKMIYQGKWTGSTCANAQANAQVTTQAFGLKGNSSQSTYWRRNINRVGYTFNNDSSIQDSTTAISVDTVFGSDSSPSTNNERSNIKKYIEDTWYASNMTSYTSKLEASAGYCNDRTAYSDNTTSTSLSTIPPYATSSASMYFGAYGRNANATKAGKKPSLTCPRSTVDLYRYVSGSTGVSNQLKYPAALLTADEASFAGSGRETASQGSAYHINSFLNFGSVFWLLSPYDRYSNGPARGFSETGTSGHLYFYIVDESWGVRPSISLKPGSMAVSGSGTAADPWIVDTSVKPNPYCTDASTCMQNTTNPPACGTTMTDGRDGNTYTTATIGGACWMTQNLRFTGADLKVGESDVTSDITMTYGQLTSGDSYTEPRIATGSTTDYGTYYNYCAASAGEVCNDTTQQDATRSVCPAGWKLPTQAQLSALPSKESHFTASSGLAGYYYGGSLLSAGTGGRWWASTAASATRQYDLRYGSDVDIWRVFYGNKYSGNSVRCVRAS